VTPASAARRDPGSPGTLAGSSPAPPAVQHHHGRAEAIGGFRAAGRAAIRLRHGCGSRRPAGDGIHVRGLLPGSSSVVGQPSP
jgi:hypothetical protein